jgi:hypothetical protein
MHDPITGGKALRWGATMATAGLFFVASMGLLPGAFAAQNQEAQEVVANLAAGRVAVLVAKGGIVIATAESKLEAGTLPPLIVPLNYFRVAVLMGPAEWVWPGGGRPPVRLDVEMLHAIGPTSASRKRALGAYASTDIEEIGLGFLDPLRAVAGQLHGRLKLNPEEPFFEMLLADYAPDYGPEVWSLRYRVTQEELRGGYYSTMVHRPEYVQLYPPNKGQPKTLVETRYPTGSADQPAILDLLKGNDPRLAALRGADPGLARAAAGIERGESQRIPVGDGLEFVRAAFQSVTPRDARQMIVVISEEKGLGWVIGQSDFALPPGLAPDAGAPTLLRKP